MAISIRLTDEEKSLPKSDAKLNSHSLAGVFGKALFERIEDQIDIDIAKEAHKEFRYGGCKSRPINELWQDLNL